MILLFTLLLFSANSVNANKPSSMKFNRAEVKMYYNQEYTLKVSFSDPHLSNQEIKWFTTDKNVAQVSESGKILSGKIGEAIVIARCGSMEAKCRIIVTPTSELFEVPCLDLGHNKNRIKSMEKRNFMNETDETIMYGGENRNVKLVLYQFKNEGLMAATVAFNESDAVRDELRYFMEERYDFMIEKDGFLFFTVPETKVIAGLGYMADVGLCITYIPR